jgi:hypothetical protein
MSHDFHINSQRARRNKKAQMTERIASILKQKLWDKLLHDPKPEGSGIKKASLKGCGEKEQGWAK